MQVTEWGDKVPMGPSKILIISVAVSERHCF